MATFLLVHGGWAGGWQWQAIARLLRHAGHEVFVPTLTGLGERVHLAHPGIDLDTHITDITNMLEYEELTDIILVGHSYGGMVISGVAGRASQRLRQLVYLDAFVPRNGESVVGITTAVLGPAAAAHLDAQVRDDGDGWRVPRAARDSDGAPNPRATDHPFQSFNQPLTMGSAAASALPRTYVRCTERPPGWPFGPILDYCAARAREAGWDYRELATAHPLWRTAPREVADLLLTLV